MSKWRRAICRRSWLGQRAIPWLDGLSTRVLKSRRSSFENLEERAAPSSFSAAAMILGSALSTSLARTRGEAEQILASPDSLRSHATRRPMLASLDNVDHLKLDLPQETPRHVGGGVDDAPLPRRGSGSSSDVLGFPLRGLDPSDNILSRRLSDAVHSALGSADGERTAQDWVDELRGRLGRMPTSGSAASGGGNSVASSGGGGGGGGAGGHTHAPRVTGNDSAEAVQFASSAAVAPASVSYAVSAPAAAVTTEAVTLADTKSALGSTFDGSSFLQWQREQGSSAAAPAAPATLSDIQHGLGSTYDGASFLQWQRDVKSAALAAPSTLQAFASGFGAAYEGSDFLTWQRQASSNTPPVAATENVPDASGAGPSAAVVAPRVTGTGFYGGRIPIFGTIIPVSVHTFNVTSGPDQVINVSNGTTSVTRTLRGNVVGPTDTFPAIAHGEVFLTLIVNGNRTAYPESFEDTASGNTIAWGTGTNGSQLVNVTFAPGRSTLNYVVTRMPPGQATQTADVYANNNLNSALFSGTVAVNRVADAVPDPVSVSEDAVGSFNVLLNDLDDDQSLLPAVRADEPLRVTEVNGNAAVVGQQITLASGAKLTVNSDGSASYDPRGVASFDALKPGEIAMETFAYRVTDGYTFDSATVTVTVTGVDDSPRLVTREVTKKVVQGQNVTIAASEQFFDPDTDALEIDPSSISTPARGVATVSDDGTAIVYQQTSSTPTDDRFTYRVKGAPETVVAAVILSVVEKPVIVSYADDVAPVLSSNLGANSFTNDARPVLRGSAEPDAVVTLQNLPAGQTPPSVKVGPDGVWQVEILTSLPDKAYSIFARAVSAGLNGADIVVDGDPFSFTVDTVAPTVTRLDSGAPLLGKSPVSNVAVEFSELVAGVGISSLSLTRGGGATNLLLSSAAQINPTSGGQPAKNFSLTGLSNMTQPTGTYDLKLNAAGSGIVDQAGNALVIGRETRFAVDALAPTLKVSLNAEVAQPPQLALPVAKITSPQNKLLDLEITEQTFLSAANGVSVNVALTLTRPDGTTVPRTPVLRTVGFAAGADALNVKQVLSLTAAELQATEAGSYAATIQISDGAGNVGPAAGFSFDVAGSVAEPTGDAPNTPVHSELFYIGARLLERAAAEQNIIIVDQPIPAGYMIALGGVAYVVGVSEKVSDRYRLSLTTDGNPLNAKNLTTALPAETKIAWLRPWQTAFDKTTQTTWFTLEDGHQLGHFDPATGQVDLFDVSLPGANGVRVGFDPHGSFFDFDTHVTPRVWLVYRNTTTDSISRVSYFDLVEQRLYTYDFADAVFHGTGDHHDAIEGTHAVFVDALGDVWITAEHNGAIVQLDLDKNSDFSANLQNSTRGQILVHMLPEVLGDRGSQDKNFKVHGVQVVVDERTGQQYVYAVDAGSNSTAGSTGRLVLLLPGMPANPNDSAPKAVPDRWFEWNFDPALDAEAPGAGAYRNPQVLFPTVDDNETPGIPEDDRVIIGDTGFNTIAGQAGVIRRIDVGAFVRTLFVDPEAVRPLLRDALPLSGKSTVETVRIPGLNGARGEFASPVQTFVDREGVIYAVDAAGGAMRVDFDQLMTSFTNLDDNPAGANALPGATKFSADVLRRFHDSETSQAGEDSIPLLTDFQMTGVDVAKFGFKATPEVNSGGVKAADQSPLTGVDQYLISDAATRVGGGGGTGTGAAGPGPFRGAMNATNVLYGSISQSDYLSTTIFGETARRQMAVVASPTVRDPRTNLPPTLRGRMAFQVLRDGSLVMTARADGSLLDQQKNLSAILTTGNPAQLPDSAAFDGEPAAIVGNDGRVYVVGKSRAGSLVAYRYDGGWTSTDALFVRSNWTAFANSQAPSGALMIGDPAVFSEQGGRLAIFVTTSDGNLLRYYLDNGGFASPQNLTSNAAGRIFSTPGVVQQASTVYVYGANQSGELIEYQYVVGSATIVAPVKINVTPFDPGTGPSAFKKQSVRDVRVYQDIEAVVDGGVRHVYATDGNSRLVHIEVTGARAGFAENVSQLVADTLADNVISNQVVNGQIKQTSVDAANNDQAFGQFPFQEPYVGRVYSGLEVLVNSAGRHFVYGTNGANLILFIRSAEGPTGWRIANVTSDGYSIYGKDRGGAGQAPTGRLPANAVFGSPSGYIESNDDRHIFQINAEGEVVEYYILFSEAIPRFHTQNINLRTGRSPTELLFPETV